MSLLPILAGLLLVLPGHDLTVRGAPNAARGDYYGTGELESLIDRFYSRLNRQLQDDRQLTEKRILETVGNVPNKVIKDELPPPIDPRPNEEGINFKSLDENEQADIDLDTIVGPDDDGGAGKGGGTTTTEGTAGDAPVPPQAQTQKQQKDAVTGIDKNSFIFIFVVAACSIAGLIGVIMAGVCWYKLHHHVKAASDVDYPAYGVTGPTKERLPSPGDRKLAQSAQMYHYQHQKQQMIALEKANGETKHDASEDESEEENEEGDYTVYECPGLAPTGEMEVRNPLFTEAPHTPVNGEPMAPSKDGDK